jgi:hypothetical protein
MKRLTWTDEKGYRHSSLVRDEDTDAFAPYGIPCDPPDLNLLDWEEIKKELWNRLVDQQLFTWADVQHQGLGLSGALRGVLLPRLNVLYRTSPNGGDLKEAK